MRNVSRRAFLAVSAAASMLLAFPWLHRRRHMAYLTGKCVGFFDRSGIKPGTGNVTTGDNFNTWPNNLYNANLGGFVMREINFGGGIQWANLQPSAGTPAGSGALAGTGGNGISAIDHAFYVLDAYAATNPTRIWTGKLRVFAGEYAPAWAQGLGVGPISSPPPNDSNATVSCSAWWDSTYQAAFAQFMLKLAAYVPAYTVTTTNYGLALGANTQKLDGHPLMGEITESACMTLFAEPLMKDDYKNGQQGSTNAQTAGWTLNADYNLGAGTGAQPTASNSMQAAWTTTPVSKAANPFVVINSNTKDEARTEGLIDYLVGASLSPVKTPNCGLTFPHAVMENNSVTAQQCSNAPGCKTQNGGAYADRDGVGGNYTSMYTKFAGYTDTQASIDLGLPEPNQPIPLCIQTATYSKCGGTGPLLKDTVTYCTWMGARMIEMPSDGGGYTNISPTDQWWSGAIAALIANDPPLNSGGIPPLSTLRRRHWRSFTTRH